MAFTDIDYQRIKKEVGGFCIKKTPAHLKDQLRYEYEVTNQNVIIYEVRPVRYQKDEYTKLPMAKLTYVNSRKIWKLYWMRASGKWEKYEPMETATDLSALVRAIDKDSYGCFFG